MDFANIMPIGLFPIYVYTLSLVLHIALIFLNDLFLKMWLLMFTVTIGRKKKLKL